MARPRKQRDENDQENEMEFAEQSQELARRSGENLAAAGEISGTLMRGWVELTSEFARLTQAIAHQNIEGLSRLMRCRSLSEYSQVQSDLMLRAIEEMVQLTHRIADKSKEVASEAEKRLEKNGHHLRVVA